ncbi:MAG: ABC transporter ATP-binding protein [Rhodospirillales bacterium]|nr:ABC transporter ATP-binding protein [Rhodospirillales bacterium]
MNTPTRKGAGVRLVDIVKRYGQVVAVKKLSLDIAPGTLVTLLGPSGCGKTTLLRMVAGLETPSEGRIEIGGFDVTSLSARERNVSMVFQSYALFPHMSVEENVAYGLVSSGLNKTDAAARARRALETVGLAGYGLRLPSEMSGGQQQRVAVARALVLEPDVLLFDEPLSNLDARLRRSMREEIRALQQSLGLTAIYVTHDQSEALAVSDRIVVMRAAEIAQAGTPAELYDAPRDVFVATFMGEANHVCATLESVSGERGRVALGEARIDLPHRDLVPGPVDLVIRPEAIDLEAGEGAGLPGRVSKATFMGSHVEYHVDTALGDLFAVVPRTRPLFPAGSVVSVVLDAKGAILVRP